MLNYVKPNFINKIKANEPDVIARIKIVFIKTKENLILIISTNINLSDLKIINIYKKSYKK